MTTATAAGLTPDLFGYVQCVRCGTWRRPEHTEQVHRNAVREDGSPMWQCVDAAWCSAQPGRLATLKTGIDPHGDAV